MKKKLFGLAVLSTLLLTGCSIGKSGQFKNAALKYAVKFNKYNNIETYVVSLKNLKTANDSGYSFNINKLDKCDEDSTVTINYEDGKLKDYKIDLNCK